MQTVVKEKYSHHTKTINSSGATVSLRMNYIVFGVESNTEEGCEDVALNAVLNYVRDNPPKNIGFAELENLEVTSRLDEHTFEISVSYAKPNSAADREEEEEPTLSFSAGGGTRHIVEAYKQELVAGVHSSPRPGLLIGYNGKADSPDFTGVDVPSPNLRETYTKVMSVSKLDTAFRRKVGSMIGRVNNAKFKGWEAGEVMFESVSFSTPSNGAKKVVVSYEFSIRPNEYDIEYIGQKISKKGFEYVWAVPQVFTKNGELQAGPKSVYKAQVCKYADFSKLGI